jgi:hypothetical protein
MIESNNSALALLTEKRCSCDALRPLLAVVLADGLARGALRSSREEGWIWRSPVGDDAGWESSLQEHDAGDAGDL